VGIGAGVLLRALELLDAAVVGQGSSTSRAARAYERVTNRLATRRGGSGGRPLWLGTPPKPTGLVGRSVRIGIYKGIHRLLRFHEQGNPCVSGPSQ